MNISCIRCKGRGYCGRRFCPMMQKLSAQKSFNQTAKQDYFGEAPNVFVGRMGYPHLNVGVLNTESYNYHDDPLHWSAKDYDINRIISLRTSLINSSFRTHNQDFSNKMLELSQQVSLANKPVDVEINLHKAPAFKLKMDQDVTPFGPTVKLKKAMITQNPHVPTKVDKVVSDIDFKATGALNELYSHGFDEHYLTKIFSVGHLGVKTERKIVPTRWSITAVDDNLGKKLIDDIRDCKEAEHTTFFGGHLGNYFLVLLLPGPFSYELFEISTSSYEFTTDYEDFRGRKQYAAQTAGGYYASRLAVLEQLKKEKRKANVLVFRLITDEYWAPLGVWVVREAVRKAMQHPISFSDQELMLEYARKLAKKKFGYDLQRIISHSKTLKNLKEQTRLFDF